MTVQSWMMYLTLVFVATSVPGPAVLFITTRSTLYGWRKAVFAALGNITGLFFLGVVAITGLGTILKTSEIIFEIIKLAGAGYLIYLGIKMILQNNTNLASIKNNFAQNGSASYRIYLQALGVALSNPKAIIFLTALFPQFIDTRQALLPQFSLLIMILMLFSFTFLMTYALVAHSVKNWLSVSGRMKTINKFGGSVFIGFGLLLAASRN